MEGRGRGPLVFRGKTEIPKRIRRVKYIRDIYI